jgi:hypothetical protein
MTSAADSVCSAGSRNPRCAEDAGHHKTTSALVCSSHYPRPENVGQSATVFVIGRFVG